MFYYLHLLHEWFSPLRLFRYITLRALAGAGTAFLITLLAGPVTIRILRALHIGQTERSGEDLPLYQFHGKKQGTPTMGGLLIICAILVSSLLWAMPDNIFVQMTLATLCFMGFVGFLDDLAKVRSGTSKGLSARGKLIWQTLWAVTVTLLLWYHPATQERARQLLLPFIKDPVLVNIGFAGVLFFIWAVMTGASNAVNLTDGLDGLAIGCSNAAALSYLAMAYVAGHIQFAAYLQVPYVEGAGELTVVCACLLGAGLGFLWYNCHPARIFMGDTGSLAIGGVIAMIAILIKQELILIIVGGVFVIEAMSVLLQVAYFKLTGGQRLFRCAPLHHHFEYLEKERAEKECRDLEVIETMITTRFWILSIVFALLGVATLKIR